MKKIVIIGSSGAGKTMFARALGLILQVEVFHLDHLFWQCGWKRKTWHARREILEKAVLEEERWIVDGNYLGPCELHLKASDTIIFLDLFPLLCLCRLIKRHLADQAPRLDIPEGCIDRITFRRMMKVISFSFCGRKMIEQALSNYSSKYIIRLRSRKEVKDFLVQQKRKICFCPRQKSHNICPIRCHFTSVSVSYILILNVFFLLKGIAAKLIPATVVFCQIITISQ